MLLSMLDLVNAFRRALPKKIASGDLGRRCVRKGLRGAVYANSKHQRTLLPASSWQGIITHWWLFGSVCYHFLGSLAHLLRVTDFLGLCGFTPTSEITVRPLPRVHRDSEGSESLLKHGRDSVWQTKSGSFAKGGGRSPEATVWGRGLGTLRVTERQRGRKFIQGDLVGAQI